MKAKKARLNGEAFFAFLGFLGVLAVQIRLEP
jgi:hypothetical protein